jgi:3-hydroxybutyryl-CoA dehydrogenase
MNIQTICICGAGTMGRGIAQVCAAARFRTLVYEPNERVLGTAQQELKNTIEKLVAKGKMTDDEAAAFFTNLYFTKDISHCVADLIIEAIVEQPDVKQQLFEQLAHINSPKTIIASNTSSLSITTLAAGVPLPERFAGLHFFNPAPLMQLVEVVQGTQTAEDVIIMLEKLVAQLGKVAVRCADAPGFIVNRVARPFYIEALRQAERDVPPEQIDRVMEAIGFKLGPFRLMDLIGNDVNYAVSCSVYKQLQSPERLKPSAIQAQKVREGKLGKKSGEGYYTY